MNGNGPRAVIGAITLFIISCSQNPFISPETPTSQRESALDYYQKVTSLSQDEVKVEYRRLQKQRSSLESIVYTTQLALLLSVPDAATRKDRKRAFRLLMGLNTDNCPAGDKTTRDYLCLGLLWRDTLEHRRQIHVAKDELDNVMQRLRKLKTENKALREKIDALKAIEQQINRRGQLQGGG